MYNKVSAEFVKQLRQVVSPDRVIWAEEGNNETLEEHSHDQSFHKAAVPEVVVLCAQRFEGRCEMEGLTFGGSEEVAAVLKLCNDNRIPVTPRGAGSGIEGGAIPYSGGVVINTSPLKDIEVNKQDLWAKVGAGVTKMELNKHLAPLGLLFGPDPASNPCIGGMASTGGSGMSTPRYGTTKENVVSLTVATPEGSLVQTRRCVRKSSTGYDLTQLYMGSEGTLGIITELVVKVRPIPKARSGALLRFSSVRSAALTVIAIIRSGVASLARCELLNRDCLVATNRLFKDNLPEVPATLILEFQGEEAASLERDFARVQAAAQEVAGDAGASGEDRELMEVHFFNRGEDLDAVWETRRGCYHAAAKYRSVDMPGNTDKVFLSDVCVPLSKLADCIAETEADFHSNNFPCIICAHIADGNFHCCIPYKDADLHTLEAMETRMINRALAVGGTVSGEHGVGVGKMMHIIEEHGEFYIDLMRKIKRALDPHCIMNPNKIFSVAASPAKSAL